MIEVMCPGQVFRTWVNWMFFAFSSCLFLTGGLYHFLPLIIFYCYHCWVPNDIHSHETYLGLQLQHLLLNGTLHLEWIHEYILRPGGTFSSLSTPCWLCDDPDCCTTSGFGENRNIPFRNFSGKLHTFCVSQFRTLIVPLGSPVLPSKIF